MGMYEKLHLSVGLTALSNWGNIGLLVKRSGIFSNHPMMSILERNKLYVSKICLISKTKVE